MFATQELRTFFKGSPLSFIYKVPILLLATVIYTVYSVVKLSIRQLPIVFRYVLQCIVKFYENILVPIPFYVNDYLLLNIHYAVMTVCQQCDRCILRPIAHLIKILVTVKLPQLIEHVVNPFFICIVITILPCMIRGMRLLVTILEYSVIMTCVSLMLLTELIFNAVRWIFNCTRKLMFIIFISLARNLIYAYHAAKSIYLQYLLPWLTHSTVMFWCVYAHIRRTLLYLVQILQQFNRFCSDTIVQPLGHFVSTLPSLAVNMVAELKKVVNDAMHVVRQLIGQIFHH